MEVESRVPSGLMEFEYGALGKRGISEETCRKFSYGVGFRNGQPVQVASYRNEGGEVVAQKLRTADKNFSILGDGRSLGLWGMHLWGSGKMLVITEGEIDAMSVSQAQNNKWPVCSIPSGAAAAAKVIRKNIEYLGGFDSVIFMFDQDEPGQKAAAECASLLPPGTAKIASLPLKDPNEMLLAGRSKEIISAIWNAKDYRPDGVVPGEEVWDRVANDDE
ncbi:MAG: toprim domain-containing protein, partial [Candidatus Thalassarchaeaceae archaeon]|nr:toprim domain-containing protein [Candidatus Thalassarchaeaceae archaeon]